LPFAVLIFIIGMGMGMFAAPNTTAIMNSVPPEHRGVSSGMRATFQNTANTLSITLIFTVVTLGLAASLPSTLYSGLTQAGIPTNAARAAANLPPTGALFAAFLGYNPLGTLLPHQVIQSLSAAARANILGKGFFPTLLSGPFEVGLRVAFLISAVLSVLAALASLLRGKRYIPELENQSSASQTLSTEGVNEYRRPHPQANGRHSKSKLGIK
jgi:hypothetical protein